MLSFDERERRRPSFDPDSVPADFGGTTLYLPKPRLTIRRRHDEAGRSVAVPWRSFGPDFDGLVEAVAQASESGSVVALASGLFDLAADLIRRNYDVTEDDLDALLSIDPSAFGESMPEPWATVWSVALCLPPKSNGPGSSPRA